MTNDNTSLYRLDRSHEAPEETPRQSRRGPNTAWVSSKIQDDPRGVPGGQESPRRSPARGPRDPGIPDGAQETPGAFQRDPISKRAQGPQRSPKRAPGSRMAPRGPQEGSKRAPTQPGPPKGFQGTSEGVGTEGFGDLRVASTGLLESQCPTRILDATRAPPSGSAIFSSKHRGLGAVRVLGQVLAPGHIPPRPS
eukprot:2528912-Pyramimonas_sp.AAC.2